MLIRESKLTMSIIFTALLMTGCDDDKVGVPPFSCPPAPPQAGIEAPASFRSYEHFLLNRVAGSRSNQTNSIRLTPVLLPTPVPTPEPTPEECGHECLVDQIIDAEINDPEGYGTYQHYCSDDYYDEALCEQATATIFNVPGCEALCCPGGGAPPPPPPDSMA